MPGHRHVSSRFPRRDCSEAPCLAAIRAGIEPEFLTRREVLLVSRLLPPGRLVGEWRFIPDVSTTPRGLTALANRVRRVIEPTGWTILSGHGLGYALVRMPDDDDVP